MVQCPPAAPRPYTSCSFSTLFRSFRKLPVPVLMAAVVLGMLMQPMSQHAWAGLRFSMTKDRSVLTLRRRTSSSGLIIGRRGNFRGFDRNRAPANVVLANTLFCIKNQIFGRE